jgi:serine/threonine protein kinase/predicted ATPase
MVVKAAADLQTGIFRFESIISSKGSFGELWLATDTVLDRPVAIKRPKAAHDPVQRERFLAEARMLAKLNHPNITQIYTAFFDETEDTSYLVMEYVDGRDLAEIIAAGTPLPLDWILDVARGILHALGYAHDQGVVHRDVKPENVMIASDVKLTDFGLADLRSILQQGTDYRAGTPAYMAPEQIEGRTTDGRADLYALGVILFEMLSDGSRPFEFSNVEELLGAHLHETPRPISQFAPTVPPVLEDLIKRLLAKDPADRFPSAEAVIEVLDVVPAGQTLGNLPESLTPFVGREAELAALDHFIADPRVRLVTIIGPGGMGKTRLALATAERQLQADRQMMAALQVGNRVEPRFPDGAYLVSLAPLGSVDHIVPTLAEALNLQLQGSEVDSRSPKQQILDHLRQKSLLLLLDNYEHLLDGADLVADILQAAPDVQILATSRERLHLHEEQVFLIRGLQSPEWETLEDAAAYAAVQLFLHSGRRVRHGFALQTGDLTHLTRICRLVEGTPLGIELAAAWVDILSLKEIADEIAKSLDILETDLRDIPVRQQSVRAVFDHSWRLLSEHQRQVLQHLSVFRGGFSRQAAKQVAGGSLRDLRALTSKSLLQRTPTERYVMQELLRQYTTEKLEASGAADAARDAHSTYYADFLHQRERDLKGHRQLAALAEIDIEFENARTAWNWALNQKDYAVAKLLLGSLGWYCTFRGRNREHQELFRHAREQLAPVTGEEAHPVWGRILVAEFYASPHEVDSQQIETSLAIAQQHDDRGIVATCLRTLGDIALAADENVKALAYYEESLAIYRDLEDSFSIAASLSKLAETCRAQRQPEKAIEYARQSLNLSRQVGDEFWAASALVNTGTIAFFTGNFTESEGYLREANNLYRLMGYRLGIATSNVGLSRLAFLRGDFENGKALAEEAQEIAAEIGSKQVVQSARDLAGMAAKQLGEEKAKDPVEQEPVPTPDIPAIIGRFEVKELLALGDARRTAIYRAYDPDHGRNVALKVASRTTSVISKLFKREADWLSKLAHPNLVECYGFVENDEQLCIVFELIDGNDLEATLEEHEGYLHNRDVIEWTVQICDALGYMHSQRPAPLILRDMKPANVMIEPNGRACLIDFGITEPYRAGREQLPIGTEGYSPPEQYFGYTDVRSDLCALGATLHHLLTRRDPRKEKPFSFHEAPPRSLNPAISQELEAVILKSVEFHPDDRFQSAEQMKDALLACIA